MRKRGSSIGRAESVVIDPIASQHRPPDDFTAAEIVPLEASKRCAIGHRNG